MSSLAVYHHNHPECPSKVLTHFEDIVTTLGEVEVRFERSEANIRLEPNADAAETLDAYGSQLDGLCAAQGSVIRDVVKADGGMQGDGSLPAELCDEHCLSASESWFFVLGHAVVFLHIGEQVYAVQCNRGDILQLPAGAARWIDTGDHPQLIAFRLCEQPLERCGSLTGNDTAARFSPLGG
jgi:1,2-dihydroxy-3-keto-5-methylthiopentene dioxygenase